MKRMLGLLGLASVMGSLIAALAVVTASGTTTLPMTDSFTTSDYAFTAAAGGTTVNIATGGTVDFSYPSGSSRHNVDFGSGPQPTSCTLGTNSQAPPIPSTAAAPGWAGTCTFDTPGTYTFHCDLHTFMTGTIVVGSAATTTTPTTTSSTTTTATQPVGSTTDTSTTTYGAPTTTMPPMTGMPVPGSGGSTTTKTTASPLAGSSRSAIKIATPQKGGRVSGSIKISASGDGGHGLVTVLASRAALNHSAAHPKQLVTLGSTRLGHLKSGTAKFTVAVKATANRAFITYRRLAATVRITVTGSNGKTVTFAKAVLLRE